MESIGNKVINFLTVKNHFKKNLLFNCKWLRANFIFFLTLINITVSYSQNSESQREINEAISNANNGKYEQAIPVLKKYSEVKEFDNFTRLRINTYLSAIYLLTNQDNINLNELNSFAINFFNESEFSIKDTSKVGEEIQILYHLSNINTRFKNYEQAIYYKLKIKNFVDKNHYKKDNNYLNVLKDISWGYYNLGQYDLLVTNNKEIVLLTNILYGDSSLDYLIEKNNLALSISYLGDFDSALEINALVLEKMKNLFGDRDLNYLTVLYNRSIILTNTLDYNSAKDICIQVVNLRKELLGENHPDYLASLSNLAMIYSYQGEFESSLEINKRVVSLKELNLGEKHPDYIFSLDYLSNLYAKTGNFQEALETEKKVVEFSKMVFGELHPAYLLYLNNLGVAYSDLGFYQAALEIFLRVAEDRKIVLGEDHPDYMSTLNNLGSTFNYLNEPSKAIEYHKMVLQFRKKHLGEAHPDYFTSLNNLAFSYNKLGDFQKAKEIGESAVESSKEILGIFHPIYLTNLNNLASYLSNLGDYRKSSELFLEVIELRKGLLGEFHPDYIMSLNNLASVYSSLGDYQLAFDINKANSIILKENLGSLHPIYLISLYNLALSYSEIGDFNNAIKIYKYLLFDGKDILGVNHPNYLSSLNNIANIYSFFGDNKNSIFFLEEAIELGKIHLGENHPDNFIFLNNLASNYSDLGESDKAFEIYYQVLENQKKYLGDKHPSYLTTLGNLAHHFQISGNFEKALEYDLLTTNLEKEVLGKDHPNYINSLSNLSFAEFNSGKFIDAGIHLMQVLNFKKTRVSKYFSFFTDSQREQFWQLNKSNFSYWPLFLEFLFVKNKEELRFAFDIALFTKGLLINTNLDFEKLIKEDGSAESILKYELLKLHRLQIQRLYERPISERYMSVDSLETISQNLEADLVKLSKEYGDYTRNLKITWEEVQSNLGEKDVAIEFLEYPTLTDTVKYSALVLRRGWENPKFVPLFRKDQIDGIFKQGPNQIYSYDSIGKELKKLVWGPLEELIALGDKVHFSAAGIFHQLAIENLSYDESTTLGDRYQMYRLSSTKELAFNRPKSKNQNVALYGGIKYDLCLEQMIASSEKYERKDSFLAVRGIQQDSLNRKGKEYLPGTLAEVNEIGKILKEKQYQVTEFIGESGSEESLKDLSGKRTGIIHIATHGFFLPVEQSKRNPFIQKRFDDRNDNAGYVDPMLRSGLLLAGGNRAWQGDSIPDSIEDGVLTAKEISNLDLRETDLVVLSACETGLGEVSSEGVFGLQRAFKQAGAQTIIMSLWNVNDEATQYLMTNFYSYLTQGASKREAFIQARNKCRERYQDPASWAAFIMLD